MTFYIYIMSGYDSSKKTNCVAPHTQQAMITQGHDNTSKYSCLERTRVDSI